MENVVQPKYFDKTKLTLKSYLTKGGPTRHGTQSRIKELFKKIPNNLEIFACNNTMKRNHVTKKYLLPNVKVTPSGVVKLIELQHQGYSYIKIK